MFLLQKSRLIRQQKILPIALLPPHALNSSPMSASPPIAARSALPPAIENLLQDFALLDDWEERYRYVVELGGELAPLAKKDYSAANKVSGCASQVWLVSEHRDGALHLRGDSDAHIVRGLIAILLKFYSGRPPQQILASDADQLFTRLGLADHLTAQRANGFRSMVERIRALAAARLVK